MLNMCNIGKTNAKNTKEKLWIEDVLKLKRQIYIYIYI